MEPDQLMTRYMGTETEYGISTPSDPTLSPILTSTHAVVAYNAAMRWNYEAEEPLADARGFNLRRYKQAPTFDPGAIGIANVIVANGGRFYVDHAHPEYSSPECSNAWDAMVYDQAGDLVLLSAARRIAERFEAGESVLRGQAPCPPLKLYKNNVDGKGASYGSHENYQYSRHTDFDAVVAGLIPFFVARQVVVGAGRVGIGEEGDFAGFQISQRADYFVQEVSLETTLNRGIINTRDEPHADPNEFRRLHTIIGDANMSQTSNLLKLGLTKLVLDAIERGARFDDLRLADPVRALKTISRDPSLKVTAPLADGRKLTALDILATYRARLEPLDDVDAKVLQIFDDVAADLARDPLSTADRLDWVAKYALMQRYGLTWDDPKLRLIDLQYADIDPAKSIYYALVRKNAMRTLVEPEVITAAADNPPADSRAYFRGRVCAEFHPDSASWQTIAFGTRRMQLGAVDKWTKAETGAMLDAATSVDELLAEYDRVNT